MILVVVLLVVISGDIGAFLTRGMGVGWGERDVLPVTLCSWHTVLDSCHVPYLSPLEKRKKMPKSKCRRSTGDKPTRFKERKSITFWSSINIYSTVFTL